MQPRDLRVESSPQGRASTCWLAEAHRPMGKPCAHLAWTWTKGLQGQVQSNWGQGPPPTSLQQHCPWPVPTSWLEVNTLLGTPWARFLLCSPHAGHSPGRRAIRPERPFPGAPHHLQAHRVGRGAGRERSCWKHLQGPSLPLWSQLLGQQVAGTREPAAPTPDTWKRDLWQHHESVLSQSADEL